MALEPSNLLTPPSVAPGPGNVTPLSPSDERTWAMLAHLSVLLNLVTGFLGPVAADLFAIGRARLWRDRRNPVQPGPGFSLLAGGRLGARVRGTFVD